jgi:hypothetical protein
MEDNESSEFVPDSAEVQEDEPQHQSRPDHREVSNLQGDPIKPRLDYSVEPASPLTDS